MRQRGVTRINVTRGAAGNGDIDGDGGSGDDDEGTVTVTHTQVHGCLRACYYHIFLGQRVSAWLAAN